MAIKIDRPGSKAEVKFVRMSASKARVVLDLVRGKKISEAFETLQLSERRSSEPISKCLNSAVANAVHNESIPAEELYVSECYADEGATLKRFKPRARGRASKIHKQTCHITIQVSRFSDEELELLKTSSELKAATSKKSNKKAKPAASRADRVAKSKKTADVAEPAVETEAVEAVDVDEATDKSEASSSEETVASEEVKGEAESETKETETASQDNESQDNDEETK